MGATRGANSKRTPLERAREAPRCIAPLHVEWVGSKQNKKRFAVPYCTALLRVELCAPATSPACNALQGTKRIGCVVWDFGGVSWCV